MKIKQLIAISVITVVSINSSFGQARKHHREEREGKAEAAREEFQLDRRDTHGGQGEPGKDIRPEELSKYHLATFNRITALLKAGKITEAQGTEFKLAHTEVTNLIKEAKESDSLTNGRVASIRKELDAINDGINAVVTKGDEGDDRTPILNRKQHTFEELIEFGERSGRLSSGEASTLRRSLERLIRSEERIKSGSDLSTKEREKLHEEAAEIRHELRKKLIE
jgi:hypothetical protein